jgi:transcriptional regulator with XRE-family HTH domain
MKNMWYTAFMNDLATNLKKLRRKKGYTQAQLAEMCGLTRRIIVHYENYVKDPVFENVKKIAEALDVSIDELSGKAESGKHKKQDDVSYKIMKRVRVIEKLPKRDQDMVFSLINSLVKKNKVGGLL